MARRDGQFNARPGSQVARQDRRNVKAAVVSAQADCMPL
jgi:hypothetical protein